MWTTYYGTKQLIAKPMTRGEYNAYRGWTIPADENPADEGYLVEYQDGGKPNMSGHAGYVSWSPKDVFEAAYQPTTSMSFGHALAALKQGHRVARKGWNGKGMWLTISPGSKALPAERFWAGANRDYAVANGGTADVLPCITQKTATGEILMGWLAAQIDIFANDWEVVQ